MLRIPARLCGANKTGINDSVMYYCHMKRLRIIHEHREPIHILEVIDLDTKFKAIFYMHDDIFTLNATILSWMKSKMKSLRNGNARK